MSALPCPADDGWFAAAEQEFDKITTFLRSQEAGSLTHSDLERELEAKGRELMRKLLQAHLDLRGPGEAAGPVRDAAGETLFARTASRAGVGNHLRYRDGIADRVWRRR